MEKTLNHLIDRTRNIKLLAFDVDGIMTDNKVWMNEVGQWRRAFSVRDGYGLQRLRENGYLLAIITGSQSDDVRERAKVLKFHFYYEGSLHKMPALEDIKEKTGLEYKNILYMGDDLFDVPLIERAGIGVTVPEASEDVLSKSTWVTKASGGNGAVREVCDWVFMNGYFRGQKHD